MECCSCQSLPSAVPRLGSSMARAAHGQQPQDLQLLLVNLAWNESNREWEKPGGTAAINIPLGLSVLTGNAQAGNKQKINT